MAVLKDAVQPEDWYKPREQFGQFEKIPAQCDWFSIYRLPGQIIAICEPYHFQEVISYLVLGSEKNLLIDTGMGMFDMKNEVEHLSDKPLLVVNTHTHFDHIGGNYQFEGVHVLNHPQAIARLNKGVATSEVQSNYIHSLTHR